MNKALALALIAAAGAVSGCASTKEKNAANPGACPNAVVLNDASRLVDFNGAEEIENVAYSAEIQNVTLDCRYFLDKPIDATVKLKIAFGRGPKGGEKEHNFTYFVAVTRTNLEVIAKQEYVLPIKFDDDESVRTVEEKIEQILIPRASETVSGENFEVIVGLSLTPEQVLFNRSGKSLKFPDLQ